MGGGRSSFPAQPVIGFFPDVAVGSFVVLCGACHSRPAKTRQASIFFYGHLPGRFTVRRDEVESGPKLCGTPPRLALKQKVLQRTLVGLCFEVPLPEPELVTHLGLASLLAFGRINGEHMYVGEGSVL